MIELGLLQPEQLDLLHRELALDALHTMSAPTPGEGAAFADAADRIAVFGRYVQLEFLGTGGMARVYKAYDPSLARSVALKLVKVEDPRLAHRLLLEARSQARIEHEHVCKIYETGEAEGKPYIAMQYIAGKTLKQLKDRLSLRQKVELLRQAAEGVHAAHRAGLIHRDLKPANILIENRESGPVAYVMDFGLAREIQAPALTISGLIVGTPSYMSPEQVRGQPEGIDARTDIYSLGATLYEMVTERPPFEGTSTTEILMQVVDREPVSPRRLRPELSVDLQTIILKCLDKNPDRRYSSARFLAEDMSRFLDGDPIQARSASWIYHVNRKIRKHPVVSLVIAVAVFAAIVSGAAAGLIQWRANRQASLLQEFGASANGIEGIMRFAFLLPLHDISPERQMVRDRMQAIADRMAKLGPIAQGPGHYAIARGLMALQQYGEARAHLELAMNRYHYRQPGVAYAYGLTLTMMYQDELEAVARIPDRLQRETRIKEIERDLRDPALENIRQGSRSAESPEYAEAIIGFLEKRYGEAIERSQQATRQIPWLYEAKRLEGDCRRQLGLDFRDAGKSPEALQEFAGAEQAYQDSTRKGMSDPLGYVGLCSVQSNILEVQAQVGGPADTAYSAGKIDCGNALLADPRNTDAFLALSSLHIMWASYLRLHEAAVDIRIHIESAVQAAQKAAELQPENARAHRALGQAYYWFAQYEYEHLHDPLKMVQSSDASYRKAIQINPNDAYACFARGRLFWIHAQYLRSVGKDPRGAFDLSSQFLQKALELNPRYFASYQQLGNTLWSKGAYEAEVGLDPTRSLDASLEALQKAMDLNPGFLATQMSRGFAALVKGEYLITVGRNPQEPFQLAEAAYQEALRIHPDFSWALKGKAHVSWRRGEYTVGVKANPSSDVLAARSALVQCLAVDSNNRDCYFIHGQVELVAGRWKMLQHISPEPEFRESLRWLNRALEVTSPSPNFDAWFSKANLAHYWAAWKVESGQDAEAEIRLGLESVSRAIELNPGSSEMISTHGVLLLLQARSAQGDRRRALASQAVLRLQEALKLNANLSHAFGPYLREAQALQNS